MKYLSLIAFLFLTVSSAWSCTDFRLTAKDGTVLITRTLEFAIDFNSNLRTSPRGRVFNTVSIDNKPALSWKAKYGYVYLDAMNIDVVSDGMNEAGLSYGALLLPNFAQYQTVPAGKEKQALAYYYLGDWILGNFDSVDQVRQMLPNIFVFSKILPAAGNIIYPLHFAIHDATGKSIVVEYVNGKLNIYDNKLGVLTNSPPYDWQLINLNNYVHLIPTNPNPVMMNGVLFAATGQGFGMIGLPGDISPTSRFVKMATLLRTILPPDTSANTLNLAEHIINNVDIPRGLAREPSQGNYTTDITQWTVFKDLTHKIFYYRTYNDLSLRAVELTKINMAENAPRLKMPIAGQETIRDMTGTFLNSRQPN